MTAAIVASPLTDAWATAGAASPPCRRSRHRYAPAAVVATQAPATTPARTGGEVTPLRSSVRRVGAACHSPNTAHDNRSEHSAGSTPRNATSSRTTVPSGMRSSTSPATSRAVIPAIRSSRSARRPWGTDRSAPSTAVAPTPTRAPRRHPPGYPDNPRSWAVRPLRQATASNAAVAPRFAVT